MPPTTTTTQTDGGGAAAPDQIRNTTPPQRKFEQILAEAQALASVGGDHSLPKLVFELVGEIQKMRARLDALEKKSQPELRKSTWSTVAAQGMAKKSAGQRRREIIVAPDPKEDDIRRRSGRETLQAAQKEKGPAIKGARRLPDGSTVLTLAAGEEDALLGDKGWMDVVFGKRSRVVKGGHMVLIKGMSREDLWRTKESTLEAQYGALQVTKKLGLGGYGTILCRIPDTTIARKMTTEGAKIDNQVFACEPFLNQNHTRQCYNCMGWGHISPRCKAIPRCGGCGETKHQGQCRRTRCVNCKGDHPATDRDVCQVAKQAAQEAVAAFAHRPKTIPEPTSGAKRTTKTTAPQEKQPQKTQPQQQKTQPQQQQQQQQQQQKEKQQQQKEQQQQQKEQQQQQKEQQQPKQASKATEATTPEVSTTGTDSTAAETVAETAGDESDCDVDMEVDEAADESGEGDAEMVADEPQAVGVVTRSKAAALVAG